VGRGPFFAKGDEEMRPFSCTGAVVGKGGIFLRGQSS